MRTLIFLVLLLLTASASAGEADVIGVDVVKTDIGTLTFSVTVKHTDTGWEHYADSWEIIGPENSPYGTRTLYHPHVNEQPFTRSLTNVSVPTTAVQVTVRAHCSVHGFGGKQMAVLLPK